MNSQPLRLTQPGELPAPRIDTDSATVLAEAIETLAKLRTPYWLGDTAVTLHALASLINQAEQTLPGAVAAARDQGHTWAEIGQLLDLSSHRRAPIPRPFMIHLTRITRIMPKHLLHHLHVRP